MTPRELTVYDYWRIIKKRRYTLLLTGVLVAIATFFLTWYLAPAPLYKATTKVKFEQDASLDGYGLGLDDISTQAEVISSVPVTEKAAQKLNLIPEDPSSNEDDSNQNLNIIYDLMKSIDTEWDKNTRIIKISASHDTGEFAARFANAVAEAYREYNIQSDNQITENTLKFIESQLRVREVNLREAEENLKNFQEQSGQILLSEETQAALKAVTTLELDHSKVKRIRREASDQLERLNAGKELFTGGDERIYIEDEKQLLFRLNQRVIDLLHERSTLLLSYKHQHPRIVELNHKIAHIRTEMARELEFKIEHLQSRQEALQAQLDRYWDRYMRFPTAAIQLARLEREVDLHADLYAKLRSRHQEMLNESSQQIAEVTILDPALAPEKPTHATNSGLHLMGSLLMGLFLGTVGAFMQESLDRSISTPEEIEENLGVPVLGMVPKLDGQELKEIVHKQLGAEAGRENMAICSNLICLLDPQSKLSETFRTIRSSIQFASFDRAVKSLLVTNVGLEKGRVSTSSKSATLINLALLFAEDGKRVILIDANLRRPVIHKRLGLQQTPGLSEALSQGLNWQEHVRTATDLMLGPLGIEQVLNTPGLDYLNVLPAGATSPNSSKLLNSSRTEELIKEMSEQYDVVLFDAPPMLPVTDSVILSSKVDGVVLICQDGRTERDALLRVKVSLDRARANLLGVVLTNVRSNVFPSYSSNHHATLTTTNA